MSAWAAMIYIAHTQFKRSTGTIIARVLSTSMLIKGAVNITNIVNRPKTYQEFQEVGGWPQGPSYFT